MSPPDIDAPETLAHIPVVMEKLEAEKYAIWEGVHLAKDGAPRFR